MNFIDINVDLGEGFPHDEQLLQLVSSCNIACGGHTGSIESMKSTIKIAKENNVNIGAHPSFPDKRHFGRKVIDIKPNLLLHSIRSQVESLIEISIIENTKVTYIKPHGALYNKAMIDIKTAEIIVDATEQASSNLSIMGMQNSKLQEVCNQKGIHFIKESFADRKYTKEGKLVSRDKPHAVLHTNEEVWKQVYNLIKHQKIESENGLLLSTKTDSICFHGDTPEALTLLQFVSKKLTEHSIKITSL